MNKILIFSILIAFSANIAACGVKPGSLKVPEGKTNAYPAVYPSAKHIDG